MSDDVEKRENLQLRNEKRHYESEDRDGGSGGSIVGKKIKDEDSQ